MEVGFLRQLFVLLDELIRFGDVHTKRVALLLRRNANTTIVNDWGWSALHFAAVGGYEAGVWALLQASTGADVAQPTGGASLAASPMVNVRCGAKGKFGVHSVMSEQP